MPRRDAFSSLRQEDPSPSYLPETYRNPPTEQQGSAKQPVDLIPVATQRPKRNRDWDRAHQAEKATYRGIPKRLQETINDLAASMNIPRDELVRAFLEYSMADHQSGRLTVMAHPKAERMTLFPAGERPAKSQVKSDVSSAASWLEEAFPNTGRRQRPSGKKTVAKFVEKKTTWEARASYRLPVKLKGQIKSIAAVHDVPIGEVVLYFLDHGLRAYQAGELQLNPVPRPSRKTLFFQE